MLTAILLCLSVVGLFVVVPLFGRKAVGPKTAKTDWDEGVVLNPAFVDLVMGRRNPPDRPAGLPMPAAGVATKPQPRTISDFDAAEDRLEILYDDADCSTSPSLRIVEGEAGVELRVDGYTVARLAKGTKISQEDVSLIRRN